MLGPNRPTPPDGTGTLHAVRPFTDRRQAGRQLAEGLAALELRDPVVLALPRGGVPVAAEVARALGAPLDVIVARKIGAPGHPELGIGAVAEGGEAMFSGHADLLRVGPHQRERLVEQERREVDRRVARYRGGRPLPAVTGREVVVVDDGLATGVTAGAALRALRRLRPSRLVLAVPVCAPDTADELSTVADEVVCCQRPHDLRAVGLWYDDFTQTSDEEVLELLAGAALRSTRGDDAEPSD